MSKIKTVFLVGPTASGKTSLSVGLAKEFGGEVISADSMQIYKGIHIASAAPNYEETEGIPHYLLEFLEPQDEFSVADYVIKAREYIKDIAKRNKLPFVVGGTGLYINALADNITFTDAKTDKKLRLELENLFDENGGEEMLSRLEKIDPDTSSRLHPSDRRRIIRAFEVAKLTGNTLTQQNISSKMGQQLVEPIIIGINYKNRETLYERINKRVDIMIENGLLKEAETAYKRKAGGAFQAIGHKELFGYFEGIFTLDEAVENLKRQTRRYAKRQLTWFRRDQRINWIYADQTDNVLQTAKEIIENYLD